MSQFYDTFDDPAVSYAKGRLTKAAYGTDQATFAYDKLGRETSSTKTINGISSAVARSYNDLNNLLTLNYPDNLQVAYTYNLAGQIVTVKATPSGGAVTTLVSAVTYNVNGQITSITYGNGVITTYTYDAKNFRLTKILTVKGTTKFQDFTYTYDVSGNILSITDAVHTATQSFQYSKLNRLLKATGSYGAYTYSYDQIGNITIKEGVTYTYSKVNAGPHAVTSLSDGTVFTYDTNGNMATMVKGVDATAYIYDAENRLKQVKKNGNLIAEFAYDGDGGRTKKITYSTTTPGLITSTTTYVGSLQEKTSLATVDHIYLGSQLVASINNGVTTYSHQDHLGGTNVITNAAGVKTEVTEYKPYGEIFRRDRYGSSQEVAWYYFTGKKLDDETGLYYYGARYYNPIIGRFLTPDTIVQSPLNPQTLNRYTYCNNNPINNIDPTGHSWWKKAWNYFKNNTIVGGFIQATQTGDWGQFGRQVAVAVISAATSFLVPGGTFSSSFLLNLGAHMAVGAATGAIVGGITSEIMGGSFSDGAKLGAITGGIAGGIKGVGTSEQYQNWRAGNGFQSDAEFSTQQHRIVNMYDALAEAGQSGFDSGNAGSFSLAANSGHAAWGTNQMPLTGKWPQNGGSEASWLLGRSDIGDIRMESGPGFFNPKASSFAIQAPTVRSWNINKLQLSMLSKYSDQGVGTFALTTNCANWATGAARTIGITVPSSTRTFGYADPAKVQEWLK